jgi:hypothetical protein
LTDLVNELEEKLSGAVTRERAIFAQVGERMRLFAKPRKKRARRRKFRQRSAPSRRKRSPARPQRQRANLPAGTNRESENPHGVLKNEIASGRTAPRLFKAESERLKKRRAKELAQAEKNVLEFQSAERKHQSQMQELRRSRPRSKRPAVRFCSNTTRRRAVRRNRAAAGKQSRTPQRTGRGLQREKVRAEETHAEHAKEAVKLEKDVREKRGKVKNLHDEKQTLLAESGSARSALQAAENHCANCRTNFRARKTGSKPCRNWTKNTPFTRRPCRNCSPSNRRSASRFRNFSR